MILTNKRSIARTLQTAAATIIMLLTLATTACENGTDCDINNISYNRIKLYGSNESQDVIDYNYPDTLTVKLIINGVDSIIINKLVDASELQLPVNYTGECDTLVLEYSGNIDDTLFIEHKNIPFFISTDCGMAMYHHLTGVRHTNNLIDSATINEPEINFDWHENIKLYIAE